jgi:hypothetical protein
MGMGIVSEKDFDSELSRLKPETREKSNSLPQIIDMPSKGRGEGNLAVPDSLRKIIGETSVIEGRESALDLARSFGISPSSVSAYDNGAHSTASYNSTPNAQHNNEARQRVTKKARNRMIIALNALTPEKINEAKARDIAGIAKDMAVVIKTMEPEFDKGDSDKNRPQFIFYAPQIHNEQKYETIYAKE